MKPAGQPAQIMLLFGHITDLHLNGSHERFCKTVSALRRARQMGAAYMLVTGDLTKSGKPEQFFELARALEAGDWLGWQKNKVTIVPGNHDGPSENFLAALNGPLAPWAHSARWPVNLGSAIVLPVNTQYAKRALSFRALGNVGEAQLNTMAAYAEHASPQQHVIVAMHHPPVTGPLGFFHDLTDRARVNSILARSPHVSVCCGHDHRVFSKDRVHIAGSVATHKGDPLRMYALSRGQFFPIYESRERGNYFSLARKIGA